MKLSTLKGFPKLALLLLSLSSLTAFAQNDVQLFDTIPNLVFKNPKLESGTANKEGAVYRFSNVTTGMDGLLKLAKFSGSNVKMTTVDNAAFGWPDALQPEFGINPVTPNTTWWIDFELTFVKAGTTKKVDPAMFQATSIDVDGDGFNVGEFVKMNEATNTTFSPVSYLSGNSTATWAPCTKSHKGYGDDVDETPFPHAQNKPVTCPTCKGTGKYWYAKHLHFHKCDTCDAAGRVYSVCKHKFEGEVIEIKGPTDNFANIDTAGTQVMAYYTYNNVSALTFRMGGYSGNKSGGAGIRMNSLWFKPFSMAPATTLPVQLNSFTALRSEADVQVQWQAEREQDFSHYIVQRSTDGTNFKDIATVLSAGEGSTNYKFRDRQPVQSGTVYYRLGQVDRTGEMTYTAIRSVKMPEMSAATTLRISTYPNPVVNELQVRIPQAWQGKALRLELISANGVRVQAQSLSAAGATTSLQLGSLAKGTYLVRLATADASLQQQVIKQ